MIWITHAGNKYAMLRYLAFGLCLPMALVSLWIPINRVESQVCDGPAHYVVRGEWCLTQVRCPPLFSSFASTGVSLCE